MDDDKFEYETDKPTGRSEASVALLLLAAVLVVTIWCMVGAGFIKFFLRQTEAFILADASMGIKYLGYENLEEMPDVVFIGSSRIYRQINPKILEQKGAEAGCPGLSFYNMGIGGADSANTRFALEWLLSKPETPRRIFIEPDGADQWATIRSKRSQLFVPWNPYPIWRQRLLDQARNELGSSYKAELAILKVSASAFFNLGSAKIALEEPEELDYSLVGYYGYVPIDIARPPDTSRTRKRDRRFDKNPDVFLEMYTEKEQYFSSMSREELEADILHDIQPVLAGLSRKDLEHVGIVYPPPLDRSQVNGLSSVTVRGVEIPIITSPASQLNALYDEDTWPELGHMGSAGSDAYSAYIAPAVCGAV